MTNVDDQINKLVNIMPNHFKTQNYLRSIEKQRDLTSLTLRAPKCQIEILLIELFLVRCGSGLRFKN